MGQGSTVKLIGNSVISFMLEALCEGIVLGRKAGLSIETIVEVDPGLGLRLPLLRLQGRRDREARLRGALRDRPPGQGPDPDARAGRGPPGADAGPRGDPRGLPGGAGPGPRPRGHLRGGEGPGEVRRACRPNATCEQPAAAGFAGRLPRLAARWAQPGRCGCHSRGALAHRRGIRHSVDPAAQSLAPEVPRVPRRRRRSPAAGSAPAREGGSGAPKRAHALPR